MASVIEKAEFVQEYGRLGCELAEHNGGDLAYAHDMLENNYLGEHRSVTEWGEEFYRETNLPIPQNLEHYIDWELIANDLQLNSGIFTIKTGAEEVHIFIQ